MSLAERFSRCVRQSDLRGRDQDAPGLDPIEDRAVGEQLARIHAGLPIGDATEAGSPREDGHDTAQLAEIGVPAGQTMLKRGVAGEKGGDRRRGGRGKDRGDPRLQAPAQDPIGRVGGQPVRAQTVDDQQQQIGRPRQLVGRQVTQARMIRPPAACLDEAAHQVEDTAALIVRSLHHQVSRSVCVTLKGR